MTNRRADAAELPEDGQRARTVLRAAWQARQRSGTDPDEACGTTKTCKNLNGVGFDGLAADDDLHAAWQATLERDGKRDPAGTSIRDLVRGSAANGQ